MKKPYKKIEDLSLAMEEISDDFQIIYNHMIAIGMDYKHYMDSSFNDDKIFEFRNNILYRLNATKLHINILVKLLNSLDDELTKINLQENGGIRIHLHFEQRINDASALFDSVIFHIISAFDYVSNLVGFITLKGDNNLKWTNLAKSVRGNTKLSKVNFSNVIDELDRTFVGRLYDHRSDIIHIKMDYKQSSLSIDFQNEKIATKVISSSSFNKHFKELRDLSKYYDLSISYVLIWLLQKTNDSIIDIQYGLKEYMEQNKKIETPIIYKKGSNNEVLPISGEYWQ